MALGRLLGALGACCQSCRRFFSCIQASPLIFLVVTAITLLVVAVILCFNILLARLLSVPGALVANLVIGWLFLRLVVQVLVFPGSIVLWKRNTESSYRVEMATQFVYHLEHLQSFLQAATGKKATAATASATMEGAMLGCMVIEGLAQNFRAQQRDQVRFTAEQTHVKVLIHAIETWLTEAKVQSQGGRGDAKVPLLEWMQSATQSLMPMPLAYAVSTYPLAREAEQDAALCSESLAQLVTMLDSLQRQEPGFCAGARRFLRPPPVGSLNQLRAELVIRYSGLHYWVRRPNGREIDAMFIPCGASGGAPREAPLRAGAGDEASPLKDLEGGGAGPGPVIVWCNANAAYYETMAYESHWLDFYLAQGCSVMLFNYSGFGRSQGRPTPKALAADGCAVVDFLRRRGFTEVGVHGRSIGGIAACRVANEFPDVVKILIADRTFSTLGEAARFTFGAWAVHGLSISATWANNTDNYVQSRCYKVMLCDAKDVTIPDLAALRTAVALRAVERAPAGDRLNMEIERVQKLVDGWVFLDTIVDICDRDNGANDSSPCAGCKGPSTPEAKRPARQPVVGKPLVDPEGRGDAGDEDTQRLVTSLPREAWRGVNNTRWLEEHVDVVRTVMAPHVDNIRVALDIVGTQLNAGGTTLDESLGRPRDEACHAVRCFLANLQVWGSLGSTRTTEPLRPPTDRDIELFLQKGSENQEGAEAHRLARLAATLTPERLSTYHRQISRSLLAQVRREFRQHVSIIRRALEATTRDDSVPGSELAAAALAHLREVEAFVTAIYRFFKCVDISANGGADALEAADTSGSALGSDAGNSDDSEERERPTGRSPRPTIDRSLTGYSMCINCGHNGVLNEGEAEHLALHLRHARFGKYAGSGEARPVSVVGGLSIASRGGGAPSNASPK